MSIIDICYQIVILLLSPLVAFVFLFFRRGRARLGERFGFWSTAGKSPAATVWFHAASNGEARGLLPLMRRIKKGYPQVPLLLTATSVSAFELLSGLDIEYHLVPFDTFPLYRNALTGRAFRALVIAETEIWPGMLAFARRENIPVIIVNARISDYTVKVYRVLSPLLRRAISAVRQVCCADKNSVERLRMIGATRAELTGNMKYDSAPSLESAAQKQALRKSFPFRRDEIVVLGSLHPGEETIWLKGLAELSAKGGAPMCILAPRHMEKVEYFVHRVKENGLSCARFSALASDTSGKTVEVIIMDVFGMLEQCYALASLAFIGGSLVDVGGHNPLEASAYGTPVAMGPHDSTVSEVTAQLEAADALIRLEPGQDIAPLLRMVIDREASLTTCGERGHAVWQANRGATERVLAALIGEQVLESRGAVHEQ